MRHKLKIICGPFAYMWFSVRLFFLNFVLIFSLSCKHIDCPPEEPITDYRAGQEMKDYGYFLAGSYWVFINDTTSEIDSIPVRSNDSLILNLGYKSNCGFWITGHNIAYFSNEDQYSNPYSSDYLYAVTDEEAWYRDQEDIYQVYEAGEALSSIEDSVYEILDSLILNGITFYDVFKFKNYPSAEDHFKRGNFYSSRNIGVVKRELVDTASGYIESWSLLRYHIVQ